jgi:hypothetical protein
MSPPLAHRNGGFISRRFRRRRSCLFDSLPSLTSTPCLRRKTVGMASCTIEQARFSLCFHD